MPIVMAEMIAEAGAAHCSIRVQHCRACWRGEPECLGIHLFDLGRREEALAATQEAVDIYRRLAQTRLDAFLPDLAVSLNSSGIRLSDLGRREEALAATQEAVDIKRRLAQTDLVDEQR
jgi:tetratricopeptide (TPR) repeat protein